MGLFKKKARSDEGSQQFEETLVAEPSDAPTGTPSETTPGEEPSPFLPVEGESALTPTEETFPGEATLADEPVTPESLEASEPPEPLPESASIPEPGLSEIMPGAQPPEPEFPMDVEAHLARREGQLLLLENRFTRPIKLDLEAKATPAPRTSLTEKTWKPRHRTSLADIRRQVDRLRPARARLGEGEWLKRRFKPVARRARHGLSVIPPNILDKRIVYETEGGFVVEVTFRESGEARKRYFTVSNEGGRTKALNAIQSGKYAELTVVSDETIRNLGRPRGKVALPIPPGQVHTYRILNNTDILEVEGIGEVYARRLHELGIHTTDQLRLTNGTVIANNLGVAPKTVEQWQQMAELLCVKGIGKQSAEALVRTGITGIEMLSAQKPKELAEKANKVIDASKPRIMGSRVQPKRAWGWILAARHMKKETQPFPVFET